jgi:Uncharacterized protein conserved in bacteria
MCCFIFCLNGVGVNFKALKVLFRVFHHRLNLFGVFHHRLNFKGLPYCPPVKPSYLHVSRLEKLAEANRNRVILEAEAEAEALRVRGEAEAFAVEAKARAEAEQMAKKADAWKDYKEAAMVDMLLETLPKVQFDF